MNHSKCFEKNLVKNNNSVLFKLYNGTRNPYRDFLHCFWVEMFKRDNRLGLYFLKTNLFLMKCKSRCWAFDSVSVKFCDLNTIVCKRLNTHGPNMAIIPFETGLMNVDVRVGPTSFFLI